MEFLYVTAMAVLELTFVDLELTESCLPLPPKSWDVSHHLAVSPSPGCHIFFLTPRNYERQKLDKYFCILMNCMKTKLYDAFKYEISEVWWCMRLIPVLGRQKQGNLGEEMLFLCDLWKWITLYYTDNEPCIHKLRTWSLSLQPKDIKDKKTENKTKNLSKFYPYVTHRNKLV